MDEWVVGVDLGGTKTALGLISPVDAVVGSRRILTLADEGPTQIVERIAACVDELKTAIPAGESIGALGICCPGPIDHTTGTLINPTNLPKFYNTPLRQMLSERLNMPVVLEHDAKAAALGEMYYGAGRGESCMVYIVVGTGVGAAIIIDRQLVRGQKNFAGEIGHVSLDRNGDLCACGTRGCFETFIAGPWLERRYARRKGSNMPGVAGDQISALALQGDLDAAQVMRDAGEALGLAVASLAMILDIELFIIGGSVAKAGDVLLEPARQIAPKYSFVSVGPRIRIVEAQLSESGPILGCGWLARQALRTQTP
jgi:glucokinase